MKKCQRGVRKRSPQCEKVATFGRSNLPIGAEPEGTEHSIGIPRTFLYLQTSVCLRFVVRTAFIQIQILGGPTKGGGSGSRSRQHSL